MNRRGQPSFMTADRTRFRYMRLSGLLSEQLHKKNKTMKKVDCHGSTNRSFEWARSPSLSPQPAVSASLRGAQLLCGPWASHSRTSVVTFRVDMHIRDA